MPILIVLVALAVAGGLGFLAAGGAQYGLLVLAAAVLAAFLAFLYPRVSLLILLFSMLLSPEFGVGAVSSSRSVVVRYDDLLLIVIFFSWLARTAIMKDKPFLISTPVQFPMLAYTVLAVLSTAFGILRGDIRFEVASFYLLKYVEYFLLYFMAVNVLHSEPDLKKYLKYALFVAFLVTVYAYYYYYSSGGDARTTAPFEAAIGNVKDTEPASLGGYYLLVFGVLIGMMTEYSGRAFLLSVATFLFMFPAFLLTFSRSSYIGFAAMLFFLVLFSRKRSLLISALLGAGMFAALLLPGVSGRVKDRVTMTYSGAYATNVYELGSAGNVRLEDSAAARLGTLKRVLLEKFPERPIFGYGVTGIGIGDTQLALLVGEMGALGLFAFGWMMFRIFSTARSLYSAAQEPWIRATALGLMVSLGGLLFQSIGVNTFIIVRIMEPFWFLTALIMALVSRDAPAAMAEGPAAVK